MASVAFDTLKFARTLREKAQLSPEQAEGFAVAVSEAVQGDLATKTDLQTLDIGLRHEMQALRTELKNDMQTLRTELKSELRESEARLETKLERQRSEIVKWMFGTIGFQTLIILGAVIALVRVVRP
jgi:DNA anti-recombination protein RmuC